MKNNTTLFHFLCSNSLRKFANKNSCTEKNTITAKSIHKRWILMSLMVLGFLFTNGDAWGQNSFNSGDGWGAGWGAGASMTASAGSSLIYTTTNTSGGSPTNRFFRFFGTGTPCDQYGPSGASDVLLSPNTAYTSSTITCGSAKAFYLSVSNTTDNWVFKSATSTAQKIIIFRVQGTVRTISSTARNFTTVLPGLSPTITATLSESLSTGQAVYLRYTTDDFATSSVVSMSGSGNTYTATIPTQTASTTVKYYTFTSGNGLTIAHGDADWYTINLENNSGSNYTYTVSSGPNQYRSATSGNWGSTSTWQVGNGTEWTAASATPTSSDGAITILNGHTVTISSGVTIDEVTINSGGTVTHSGGGNVTINNGAGTDLTINGIWTRTANSFTISPAASAAISVGSTGIYEHAITLSGGTIPVATWNANSILRIKNDAAMSSAPTGLDQTFGIVEINTPNQTSNWAIDNITDVANELRIISTGTGYVATTTSKTISGSFNQSGGRFINGVVNANTSFTISGNLTVSGGSFEVAANISTPYIYEVFVTGNIVLNGGTIDLNKAGTTNANSGRLYPIGDLTVSSGSLTRTQTRTDGSTGIYYNGTGSQSFTWSGGTIDGQILKRFYYKTSSGPTALNETYSASTAQTTINGTEGSSAAGYAAWPTTGALINNVTVNNSAGATLSTNKVVNGALTLTSGKLAIGSNTLTLSGTVASMSAANSLTGSASSNLSIGGTGSLGTLFFDQTTNGTTNNLATLTLNRTSSGSATLGNAATVGSTLTLTSGILTTTSTNTLTVTSSATGAISGGSASSYINGPLDRTVANATNYTYPIGGNTSNYRPINLNSVSASNMPTSNPVVRVTVAESGAETVDGTTLDALLNPRNWNIEKIGVPGTFTSATLVITESGLANTIHEIGKSNSNQAGTYVSCGTPQTVSAGTITSPSAQGVGFYAIGPKFVASNTITLGSNAPAAASQCPGTNKVVLQSFSLVVGGTGNLTNVGFTTTGSYAQADISKYQLWFRATTNDIAGATQLGSDLSSSGGAGPRTFSAFTTPTLSNGVTYYFWITADVATGASGGTIAVNGIGTADLTSTSTKDGSTTTAGGSQTLITDPTTQATGLSFSSIGATSMTVNWSGSGNGDGVIVVMKAGSEPTDPSDNIAYTASTTFGSGATDVGSSSFVVFNGSGSSVTVTGLSASMTYHIRVYSRSCSGASIKINTTSPLSGSQITLAPELAAHAASFTASSTIGGQVDLTFSAASTISNAFGYIILQKTGSNPTGTPSDATSYTIGNTIGDGTVADIITDATQTSSTISGLNSSTAYHYSIIPFSYDGTNTGTYNYYTAATIPTANATTPAAATRYAVASGNWNATSTWSSSSGGTSGASVPTGSDVVYIQGGYTVTVTANATSGAIYFNDTSGTLSINSGVTLAGGSINVVQVDKTVSGTIAGAGTLTCTTVNVGTSAPSLTATRTTTLTSTISTLTASGLTTLTVRDNSGNKNNPTFNLQSGTFTTTGVTTVIPSAGGTATLSLASGAQTGTLTLTGLTPFTIDVDGTSTITLNGSGATVNYAASGAQTVRNTSYTNLTLSGSGNKTLTTFSISGTLSIEGSAVGITTAPTFGASSILQYKNVGTRTTNAVEWPLSNGPRNLIIDNSGNTVTMLSGNARTLTGNLTLTAGTLADNGNTLTVNGNIAGTATHSGAGKILLNTTGSTISGATFGNLELNSASGSYSLTGNPTINGTLTLANGTFTLGASGIVTIGSGGAISRSSGALAAGTGAGKFTFAGTGTVTGTVGFNDVDIAGGVNFGSASTVNGTLTINPSGFVNTNAPIYGASSKLYYFTGGNYGRGAEWSASSGTVGTTPGYPNDVQIGNLTTLNYPNTGNSGADAFSTTFTVGRDLTIDANSNFYMDFGGNGNKSGGLNVVRDISIAGNLSLGNAVGGDLSIGRNWTHTTGTFNANSRAVSFNGATGDQTITNAGGETFPFLTINKATSGGVTLAGAVTVSNTLTLTKGVVTTTSSNLLNITNTSAAAMSGGSSASYVSGPLRWSVSNGSGGDYKFHVGKSSNYLPLNVNNPTGTSPVITAEAFVANPGGTAGSGLSSLSTSEYWSVVNTGTLSAATISLAKASIGSNNGIGTSTTLAGTYNNLGGSVTSTLIASNTVTAGTTVGSLATTMYFVLGVKVAAPTITSFTPSSGYVGTTITITGTNFTDASNVTIGGVAAASYTVDNSTQITVTASTGITGIIAVTTPGGTATSASTFTFGGYISNAATDWNTASTWLGGAVPPAAATVTIDHAVTVNGTATNNPSSVTINSTKSLTFGASGALTATTVTNNGSVVMTDGGTLTIATGGTLSNGSNTFTRGTGTVAFAGTATVTGTIGFNNVTLAGGVNFGTASTINGTLTINGGGFVNTNAPTYANTSTLLYNTTGTYGRGTEWSATSGAGYPNNVQISNSTTLNLGANSGTGTARQLAGNLTVDALSTLTMNASGEAMTAALTVKGNYINNGTTTLSGSIGGDLALEGNLTDNNVFTANGRAIFFRGGNTQSITSSNDPLDIDVARLEKSGGEIVLLQNLLVDETADPIQFAGTSSILNLNGKTATFGKSGTASTITMNSTSAIKGSSTSSLSILGNGAFGTLRFDQTTQGTTNLLQNFTLDRGSSGSVSLANSLSLGGTLALTNGTLTLGGNTLTYSGSSITRTSGVIDASNANATVAFTNTSALTLPASLFSGNVNNLTMNGSGGVTLGSATTVAGTLTITNGNLNLGTNIHTAGSLSLGGTEQTTASSYGGTGSPAETINTTYFAATTGVVNVGACTAYSITSTTVSSPACSSGASITLSNTTASNLQVGTYTVYYTLNGATTGSFNATMTVSIAGSGTFSTGALNTGSATITIDYLRNGCVSKPASGNTATFTVNANNTAGAASSTPTLCISTALTAITHATTGATGIGTATGLPSGVSASWASNTITISGTPTASGTFGYSIPLTGGCGSVSATGTITVTAAPASAGNNGTLVLCSGTTLTTTLLYNALTGSPAAGGTWSPTIPTSGSVAGTYTYTQESSPCAVNTATVTVTDSQIVTWNGSWSPSAPTALTSAVIESTFETSENITACSLRVTSGATVVILSGAVTLNGPIIAESSNSFVTFNNNAILLQNGSGYVNTGNINYKKASSPIFRLDYTLWSSPLTAASQPIFDFSPQTLTNRFYTYNEATNFYTTNDMYTSGTPALSASSSFKVGRGYLIRSPNNWVSNPNSAAAWTGTFTGVPNNGDIAVTINRSTGDFYGYNAVGNPYPSPISITSFLNDNSSVIGTTLWFWRKTNGVSGSGYITYSAGTYSSGSHSVFNIQPGQGFFVRATSSGSLQFKNTQRVGTNGSFFRNNSQTTAAGEGRLWLNLKSNAIVVGNMALGYKEGATNDLDLVYDGEYLNDSPLALTSSLPGKELSVQHRAAPFVDTDVVPLSFKTDVAGTYSIDFNGTDGVLDTQDVYLEDLLLGQSVAIKTTPYTFTSAAGTFSDRFRIVYMNSALGTDEPVFNANQVVIYKNEINDFVINSGNVIMSNIKVYDVRGRLLQEYKNVNDSETTINVGSVNQVLLVQITSEDGVMVTKKVIR